ncbi:MAG: hypothetical protein HY663_04750 [Chloroflexi bacterium]|nr:hypothetical protein [Chloroflexota bacterium]
MRHLARGGALLLTVLLLVFVGPRMVPVPAVLTDFGFHSRNTNENAQAWAALPTEYVGPSVCVDCHQNEYNLREKGKHRAVSCENCHGPARAHVTTGAPEVLNTSRSLCGVCHARLVSRPSSFPQVDMEKMGGDAECITCHNPHEPRAGMPVLVPHTLEGRTECRTCHDPQMHEPFKELPPQLPHTLEGRTDCLSCHGPSEFRGAALPHIPGGMEASTNCLLCHQVGGGIKPLPADHVGRTSATCQNCHRSK